MNFKTFLYSISFGCSVIYGNLSFANSNGETIQLKNLTGKGLTCSQTEVLELNGLSINSRVISFDENKSSEKYPSAVKEKSDGVGIKGMEAKALSFGDNFSKTFRSSVSRTAVYDAKQYVDHMSITPIVEGTVTNLNPSFQSKTILIAPHIWHGLYYDGFFLSVMNNFQKLFC